MNITRSSILSMGCGIVLACGLVIILVLITAPLASQLSSSIQKVIPYFIFIFSLLVTAPLIARKLNKLDGIKKIFGWTFIGIGTEFVIFPVSLLFVIKLVGSLGALMVTAVIFTYSVVFGIPAGLISITIGIWLIKKKRA